MTERENELKDLCEELIEKLDVVGSSLGEFSAEARGMMATVSSYYRECLASILEE